MVKIKLKLHNKGFLSNRVLLFLSHKIYHWLSKAAQKIKNRKCPKGVYPKLQINSIYTSIRRPNQNSFSLNAWWRVCWHKEQSGPVWTRKTTFAQKTFWNGLSPTDKNIIENWSWQTSTNRPKITTRQTRHQSFPSLEYYHFSCSFYAAFHQSKKVQTLPQLNMERGLVPHNGSYGSWRHLLCHHHDCSVYHFPPSFYHSDIVTTEETVVRKL